MNAPQDPPIDVVVDTNVLIDVFSCHDLMGTYDRLFREGNAEAIHAPEVTLRLARARESFLLALCLNKYRLSTCSFHDEAVDILTALVPPTSEAEPRTFKLAFTTNVIWFVKDCLLPNWHLQVAKPKPGWEQAIPVLAPRMPELVTPGHPELANPTGNRADACHIAMAKQLGVPLISNEGFSVEGYRESKIKRRAQLEAVTVLFPREFYAGKIVEAEEIEDFFRRFREQAPRFVEDKARKLGPDRTGEFLDMLYGFYQLVLLGRAEGHADPVRVKIAG